MMKKLFFLVSFLILSFSLKAMEELEVIENKYKNSLDDREYVVELATLLKKHPESIKVHRSYIKAHSYSGHSDIALFKYKKSFETHKSQVSKYLFLYADLQKLGWSPSDVAKKKELLGKIEKIKDKKLKRYVLMDLAQYSMNPKDALKNANKLYSLYPNHSKDKKILRILKQALGKSREVKRLVKIYEEEINSKKIDFDALAPLARVKVNDGTDESKRLEKLIKSLKSLAKKVKNIEKLKSLFFFFAHREELDIKKQIASKILKIDPSWIPYPYLKKIELTNDYQDYEQYIKVSKTKEIADMNLRIKKLKSLSKEKYKNKKLHSVVYSKLAYAYQNPAAKNQELELQAWEKALELNPESSSTREKVINIFIETKTQLDRALKLVDQGIDSSDKDIHEAKSYFKTQKEWIEYAKGIEANNFLSKGRILKLKGDFSKAYEYFLKAYFLDSKGPSSFYLGQVSKNLGHELESLTWFAKAFSQEELEGIEKEEILSSKKYARKLISKFYDSKFSLEEFKENNKESAKEESDKHPLIGKKMIELKLNDVNGKKFNWKKLKGKNIILSFWATWCAPCMEELPALNMLSSKFKKKGIEVVTVCTDGLQNKMKVKKISKKGKITIPILLGDLSVQDTYIFAGVPSVFLINSKGIIIDSFSGYTPKIEKEILHKLGL
jgi:thiol-disulfide isomerase/thioredoxin